MTRLSPDAPEAKAATTNSDRPTPAAKNAIVAGSSMNNRRRRGTVPLPQLQSRQAQVHPNSRTTPNANATAAPFHQSQSRTHNPEAIHHDHLPFLSTSSHQQHHQGVSRIGSGAAAAADDGTYHHHAAAASASAVAGPPSPPRCSTGSQPSWPSPVKFEPEPSRIIKISSDPTLSRGRRIWQRERRGTANASSWDYDDDDDEDHEARAEDERMYDLSTWRMYHRIMKARRRREAEKAMFESHPDAAAAAAPTTAQDVERMVLHVKEQAEASYQQRLAIMENAIAITSTTANTDDDDGGAEYYCDTVSTCGEDGPPSPLTSTARSPRGLMRMLDRARKISIGAENDTHGLFTMDM